MQVRNISGPLHQYNNFCSVFSDFHSVTDDFTSKIPTIRFSSHSNLHCELSLNNFHASQTSCLLRDYNNLDERVRTLGVAFRYWASLVTLDRQAEGTLPPHSFAILLVYFLQQQSKPVLPCIHSYLDTKAEESLYTTPVEVLPATIVVTIIMKKISADQQLEDSEPDDPGRALD